MVLTSSRFMLAALLLCCSLAASARRLDEGDATAQVSGSEYFAVPAFFVTLRESVEACVVLAVMLKFLDKINRPELKKHVWLGAGLALLIACIVGVGFIIAYYEASKEILTGKGEQIFEGTMTMIASFIITILAVSMLKIAKCQEAWERKLALSIAKAEAKGGAGLSQSTMFWIPFTCVLREGLETVVFIAGTAHMITGTRCCTLTPVITTLHFCP